MSGSIGPALPPHLQKKEVGSACNATETPNIGPALPPWMKEKSDFSVSKENEDCSSSSSSRNDHNGKQPKDAEASIGPTLPSWLKHKNLEEEDEQESFGPSLPPEFAKKAPSMPDSSYKPRSNEDDGPIIGPLPPSGNEDAGLSVAEEIEKRSKKMKDRLTGKEEPKKLEREEWMLELPPLLQGFGAGPRKFRAHERIIGDRSVWTDTPADKAKRAAQGKKENSISDEDRIKQELWAKRDLEISERLADAPERKESLMDIHEKARKREAEEKEASGEAKIRRPFNRELDLQTNAFDDATKKRLLKQSQGLSSRFSSGAVTSKFL